jgi:osmotically-inducible protein OsmY
MAILASATMKSDDAIRRDVIHELEWEPALSQYEVCVAFNGGVVTLTGMVPSLWAKLEAERAAKRVFGM